MLWFKNDYGFGAVPAVLERLARENGRSFNGYGLDDACDAARSAIRSRVDRDIDIHFVEGGTQANALVIAALLRPWESAVAAPTGHINVHETGAVEHQGIKIETVGGRDYKVGASELEAAAAAWEGSEIPEHVTRPRLVYISQPTEMGTLYSRAELEALRRVCDDHGLILYIDGARLAYALGSEACDTSLADIARLADAFYIGGTKCGALFGEAVCVRKGLIEPVAFRAAMKQNLAMCAKGFLIGLQFDELFRDSLYVGLGKRADAIAQRIKREFNAMGISCVAESPTNQQFFALAPEVRRGFEEAGVVCEDFGKTPDGLIAARFCVSWATTDEDADRLIAAARRLTGKAA